MSLDAVVTGASTGIGRSAVKVLVGHGWRVFAGVRKVADAESLRQEFGEAVEPLLFDVTDIASVHRAADETRVKLGGKHPQGTGQQRRLGDRRTARASADRPNSTRVRGQRARRGDGEPSLHSFARRRFLSRWRTGRIVNISSVAGRIAPPFVGDYAMSKHALEAFSDSLRRELTIYGIDVVVIGPGAIATPIWDKAEASDETVYADTDFGPALKRFKATFIKRGRQGLPVERLGETIHLALTAVKRGRATSCCATGSSTGRCPAAAQARPRPRDRQGAGLTRRA